MEGIFSSSTVTNEEQAKCMLDHSYHPLILKLMEAPRTPGVLSDELGWPMNRLYYRLKRLEAVGLVSVVQTRPRWGRQTQTYAMNAARYVIPFAYTPMETLESLLANQLEPPHTQFLTLVSQRLKQLIYDDDLAVQLERRDGRLIVEVVVPGQEVSTEDSIMASWQNIRLRTEDASQFTDHLQALVAQFHRADGDTFMAGFYLVRAT